MAEEKKPEQPEKKKFPLKKILFIVVPVVLLGVGAFVYIQMQKQKTTDEAALKMAEAEKKVATDEAFVEVGEMYDFEGYILNLNTPGDSRYLKLVIVFELSPGGSVKAEIEKKKPILSDIAISVISSKSFDEVRDVRGKDVLKEELVSKLNRILVDGSIKRIMFTEFVIQ